MLSFPECLLYVCVFRLFITFLSVFLVFHGKDLGLLNFFNRYVTFIYKSGVISEKQRHCGAL